MPHLKVCYDAYHLVSNMNQTIDRIRRFTMKHPSYALEQFMKEKRYVLLRGRENISRDTNAAMLRLILWIKMCMKSEVNLLRRFARKISEQFNEVINGIRCGINSARIESVNAAIKRIQTKACGLFDVRYLFLKLRPIYFLRLQRMHKSSRFFYQLI